MKKLVMVITLAVILAVGAAYADHPDGFGIGVQFGGNSYWGGYWSSGGALTLKIPSLPIFWAVNFAMGPSYMWLNLSGDYYLIDNRLIETLHWYLGVGGYVGIGMGNPLGLDFGARLPIGLSWQPLDLLEIYLQVVPSIGLGILPGIGLGGGLGGNLGIRLWF